MNTSILYDDEYIYHSYNKKRNGKFLVGKCKTKKNKKKKKKRYQGYGYSIRRNQKKMPYF